MSCFGWRPNIWISNVTICSSQCRVTRICHNLCIFWKTLGKTSAFFLVKKMCVFWSKKVFLLVKKVFLFFNSTYTNPVIFANKIDFWLLFLQQKIFLLQHGNMSSPTEIFLLQQKIFLLQQVVSAEADWPQLGFATGFRNSTMPDLIR